MEQTVAYWNFHWCGENLAVATKLVPFNQWEGLLNKSVCVTGESQSSFCSYLLAETDLLTDKIKYKTRILGSQYLLFIGKRTAQQLFGTKYKRTVVASIHFTFTLQKLKYFNSFNASKILRCLCDTKRCWTEVLKSNLEGTRKFQGANVPYAFSLSLNSEAC